MFHSIDFRAMGCNMQAILETSSEVRPPLLDEAPAWFAEWEQALSRFRLDSELSRLNRTFDQPVEVSAVLWEVFQTARWADDFTQGLVTPTVLNAMLSAGYDRPFDDLFQTRSGMLPREFNIHPLSLVVADERNHTITLPQGIGLDFGGIAKGWAAQKTVERLQCLGPCLMNAGGDIAVSGPRLDGRSWEVGVSNPFERGTDFDMLEIHHGGVASSGKDRRNWKHNGRLQHHIINPNTGQPVQTDVLRVTVVAATAQEAEAAAKTAFILGVEAGLAWLESHPGLSGLMILENGEVFITSSMQELLQGATHAAK